jgi:hypothetical protein
MSCLVADIKGIILARPQMIKVVRWFQEHNRLINMATYVDFPDRHAEMEKLIELGAVIRRADRQYELVLDIRLPPNYQSQITLKSAPQESLLILGLAKTGTLARDVAPLLGETVRRASRRLKGLEDLGLLRVAYSTGKPNKYYLSPKGLLKLKELEEDVANVAVNAC